MAIVYKNCDDIIAHLPGVQAELDVTARILESLARSELSRHRESGAHRVYVARGKLDRYVILEGPAAVSIEFGYLHKSKKVYVKGLRILAKSVERLN